MKLQEIRAIAKQRHISYDGLSKQELIRNIQRQGRKIWQEGIAAYKAGDYPSAFVKFKSFASKGDVDAQFFLGVMYSRGQGVEQDFRQSLKWYLKAAEQGDMQAQSKLGVMYGNAQGIPQDFVQAHKWYSLAALAGDEDSRENQKLVERMMSEGQISEAQKLAGAWLTKHKWHAHTDLAGS